MRGIDFFVGDLNSAAPGVAAVELGAAACVFAAEVLVASLEVLPLVARVADSLSPVVQVVAAVAGMWACPAAAFVAAAPLPSLAGSGPPPQLAGSAPSASKFFARVPVLTAAAVLAATSSLVLGIGSSAAVAASDSS